MNLIHIKFIFVISIYVYNNICNAKLNTENECTKIIYGKHY